jgi:uncharacterized protein DUF2804
MDSSLKKLEKPGESKYPPKAWSGAFGFPDTNELLNLSPSNLSLERFREKRWCYMGIIHPDVIFGCAVIHLGYISSAFVFGFDRQENTMVNFSPVFPPLGQVRYDRNPEQGICSYNSIWGKLIQTMDLGSNTHSITTSFQAPGKSIKADISLVEPGNGIKPMHFLMAMGKRNAYTTKIAGLKAAGQISINKKQFDLSPKNTFAIFDWTHGFFMRKTFWNWACGAGISDDGTPIGFNFSKGVYNEGVLENIIWVNGKPYPIGEIDFKYNASNPMFPWTVTSQDNHIHLSFTPEGIRSANDNFGFIKSKFIQPCGTFKGSIELPDSESGISKYNISSIGGVVEEHFAKW